MRRLRLSFIALALSFTAPLCLRAQVTTPQPFLGTVAPAAAQAGSTAELTITGTDLDGAARLHFSVPGITCAPKLDEKKQPVPNKFVVTIPAGTRATTCDVRVAARYGISNPRGFVISALPVIQLPGTAVGPEKAFAAALNTTLFGTAVQQAASFVRFEAKKGQHIVAVCRPVAVDSRMEASVVLRDASGIKLAHLQADGLLDFIAPADGSFTLETNDLMFGGGPEYPFVMTLTTGPVIQQVFDAGAQWTLYGRNLPGGNERGAQRLQVSADEGRKLLAANPVEAVKFAAESDPPSPAPASTPLKLPARYLGWFAPNGKARIFTFEAKKGDVCWIEVNCAGKGVSADPFFVVEKEGAFIAEANDRSGFASKNDFDAGSADPSYRFEAKADGVYHVKLRDLFASSTPAPFELTVRQAGKDFGLVAIPSVPPRAKAATSVELTAAPLWRGGVAVLKVFALRSGGFDGAVELAAEGLPDDVKFLGGTVREGQGAGYAAFYAEEAAKEWSGAVNLHGQSGAAARSATLVFKVGSTAKESVLTRLTDEVVLGVVASDAPVTVEAADAVVETDAKGRLSIPLQVKRRGDFTDAIKLASLGIDGLTADIAAKATSVKLEVDVAKLKLTAGDHPLLLQGVVKFKHKRGDDPKAAAKELSFLVHSKPIIIRVKPAEKKS